MVENAKPYFENFKVAFMNLWETCKSIYDTVIRPLFMIIGQIIEEVIHFCAPLFNLLMHTFSAVFNTISTIWNTVGKPVFDFLMSVVKACWDSFKTWFRPISELFGSVVNLISGYYNNVAKPMFEAFMNIVKKLLNVVKPVFEGIKNAILFPLKIVSETIGGIVTLVKGFIDLLGGAIGKIGTFLSNINPLKGIFGKSIDVNENINGNVAGFESVQNAIETIDTNNGYFTPLSNESRSISNLGAMSGQFGKYQKETARLSRDIGKTEPIQKVIDLKVNIENFTNNTEKDIEELAEELAFYLRRQAAF